MEKADSALGYNFFNHDDTKAGGGNQMTPLNVICFPRKHWNLSSLDRLTSNFV